MNCDEVISTTSIKKRCVIPKSVKGMRKTPQISSTIDRESVDFIHEMALIYTAKTGKIFTYSQTLRMLIKFCMSNKKHVENLVQGES